VGAGTSAFRITAPVNLISDNPPSVGGLVEHILGCYDDRITMIEERMLNSISIIKLIKLALIGISQYALFSVWAGFTE
jgi:hypothetical protein